MPQSENVNVIPQFINEAEASAMTGMSKFWFQRKRWEGGGPSYLKIGNKVKYDRAELLEWFRNHRRQSTTDVVNQISE